MNLRWYVRRLSRMSPAEVAMRVRDETVKRRWRRRWVRDAALDPLPVPAKAGRFATPLPDSAGRDVAKESRSRLEEAARELLAGRWHVFGSLRDDLAPTPDWFWDLRTGVLAPSGAYCFDIDHRDEATVGNAKFVWELSRHQHLTVLAAAYHLSGDRRYAEAASQQLRSWWAANPFLSGIHWTSGIELGVRLISWVWIRRLLDGWAGATELFEGNRSFLQQLHHHQHYLASLPSRGSSANNHLIAEAAGQFAASCAFPWFPETRGWRERAATVLRREAGRQTFPSGLNRELATEYHGFVLELCLAAALEGEAAGHPLGDAVWDPVRRMTDALAAVVDSRLRPPRQGDGDDGHGLLLDVPGYQRWASLVATGAALFGSLPWWPTVPREDVRTPLWTALAPAPPVGGSRPERRPSLFADAGMALLRDGPGRPDELWCRADHGPHGYLSIAAHAHADALSIEVRVGGVDVLADPGAYTYHGEPRWRSYFRSTVGHNTLEVGGVDQSTADGPFLWTRHARSGLEQVAGLDGGPVAEWRAAHRGYERLRPPAVHRRAVRLSRQDRTLIIDDTLECDGEHACRLAFHLGPDISCTLEGHRALLSWSTEEGHRTASLLLPASLSWSCLEGDSDAPAGWYSPGFGVRVPAVTLIGAGRLGRGRHLVTTLQLGLPGPAREAEQQPNSVWTGASTLDTRGHSP
jgi:Heparinase II/III-like protein/Heparinase II/III N-terminus